MINFQMATLLEEVYELSLSEEKTSGLRAASFGYPVTFLPNTCHLTNNINPCNTNRGRDEHMLSTINQNKDSGIRIYSFNEVSKAIGLEYININVFDIDPQEKPFLCWDLNMPIPIDFHNTYDLAIDSGTHEHIFNIGNSLASFASLPKKGGYIVGAIPYFSPNHGFYNVNPNCIAELFSPFNGFRLIKLIINCYNDPIESLKGKAIQSITVYEHSCKHFSYDLILKKIQSTKLDLLSSFNTLYYVAHKINELPIKAPIQRKYKG